ncbi:MAG: hydroxymethylpyrimidine/phosphomethylpyrimidine kinase [Myxococcota bacterium]|jgi:hydroxymethylpyrimidine/phosphomethylpyrimidine kinase
MTTTVLSIAGSDPSGGAGIQADLKTFLDHHVYGMAVITALTAQSTTGVTGVHPVPPDFVTRQIATLRADLPVDAIKLGMLASADIIAAVAEALSDYDGPVVLDPVMVSTSGHHLITPDAIDTLRDQLLSLATVVTPNLPESAILLLDELPQAFADRTGVAVLLKDGHGTDDIVHDALYRPDLPVALFPHPRTPTRNTHGTGCTLSSALAARLARGEELHAAVGDAIAYTADLIRRSADHTLGAGKGPLLHGLDG